MRDDVAVSYCRILLKSAILTLHSDSFDVLPALSRLYVIIHFCRFRFCGISTNNYQCCFIWLAKYNVIVNKLVAF